MITLNAPEFDGIAQTKTEKSDEPKANAIFPHAAVPSELSDCSKRPLAVDERSLF